jgi:outer membrane protein TolC
MARPEHGFTIRLSLLACLLLPAGAAAQQPLTLSEALARAEQAAYANRIAAGQSQAQAGQALAPLRGILPSVRLESGYVSTTDPLGAFGFVLRQRQVTAAAFAPDRLNDPSATHDLSTGLVVEQPLFNADAWLGRTAASRASAAAHSAESWVRSGTALNVVQAYWGAVLAGARVRTFTAANSAGESHRRQAEALVRQGMATRSDALLASVKAGEIRAGLLAAESGARIARRRLALLLGDPSDTAFTLPDSLPVSEPPAAGGARSTDRADVAAAREALGAAQADSRRATALYLPRLNGFGRVDWNAPGTPFGGRSSWTVGVMLSWSPFAGGSELAEIRAARGRRAAAQAAADAATANAGLELAQAEEAVALAHERLTIADQSVRQAQEAHRIVSRKYDGGLATVTELFDAAATETASELALAAARFDALVAKASVQRARGAVVDGEL